MEKISIPEGTDVTITILNEPKKKNFTDALDETYGGWNDTIDCEKLIKDIYSDRSISTRKKLSL